MKEIKKKVYLRLVAQLTHIGDIVHIKRENAPDIYKKVLTLVTADGQTLFPEIRNKKLPQLDALNLNGIVDLEYTFEGSEKNGKLYNNIYVNKISRHEKKTN